MKYLYLFIMSFSLFSGLSADALSEDSPPAGERCTLSVSTPVVDYGTLSRGQLQKITGNEVSPGKRRLALNAICPRTQTMWLTLRAPNIQERISYGKTGQLMVRMTDARIDGRQVQFRQETAERKLSAAVNELLIQPGKGVLLTVNNIPVQGKQLSVQIETEPVIPDHETRVSELQTSTTRMVIELDRSPGLYSVAALPAGTE